MNVPKLASFAYRELTSTSICKFAKAISVGCTRNAATLRPAESEARLCENGSEPRMGLQSRSLACSAALRAPEGNAAPEEAGTTEGSSESQNLITYNSFDKKIKYTQPQNDPEAPWTPTHKLKKWKFLPRRMGFMLQELEKEQEAKLKDQLKYPFFQAGSVLELKLAVPDNKGKPSVFKGLVIAKRNKGLRTNFTIRNHMGTAGAVERTFPLYSPTIKGIKVLEQRKVRRAKLYYLRDRNPREYRV